MQQTRPTKAQVNAQNMRNTSSKIALFGSAVFVLRELDKVIPPNARINWNMVCKATLSSQSEIRLEFSAKKLKDDESIEQAWALFIAYTQSKLEYSNKCNIPIVITVRDVDDAQVIELLQILAPYSRTMDGQDDNSNNDDNTSGPKPLSDYTLEEAVQQVDTNAQVISLSIHSDKVTNVIIARLVNTYMPFLQKLSLANCTKLTQENLLLRDQALTGHDVDDNVEINQESGNLIPCDNLPKLSTVNIAKCRNLLKYPTTRALTRMVELTRHQLGNNQPGYAMI